MKRPNRTGKAALWLAPIALLPLVMAAALGQPGDRHAASELRMIADEARHGDPNAELLYGLALLEGRYGLKPDPKAGIRWLRRSAQGGNPYAALKLGNAYAAGTGVEKDDKQAVLWWRRAAEGGNVEAKYRLGKAYLEGKGVPQDDHQAADWLEQAANEGNADAQYLLGKMYHEGYAVVQDQTLARDWLGKAAAQGHSEAVNLLALINMLVKTITPVSQESYSALLERARQGDPHAQYELGLRYETGAADVNRDPAKALEWLTRAARNGNLLAMRRLAKIYANGELGVPRDPAKAEYWRRRARGKRHSSGSPKPAPAR